MIFKSAKSPPEPFPTHRPTNPFVRPLNWVTTRLGCFASATKTITLGLATLIGRFGMMIPVMALAGSLARKKLVATSAGTFPVSGTLFVVLLVGTVLLVGALTFFPALSLGPILEHYLMYGGKLFS